MTPGYRQTRTSVVPLERNRTGILTRAQRETAVKNKLSRRPRNFRQTSDIRVRVGNLQPQETLREARSQIYRVRLPMLA